MTARAPSASWLDAPKPASWNKPGLSSPTAPRLQEASAFSSSGWNLVGAYQGGWQTRVIRATANYDGMCRPRVYQAFVFARGVFVDTPSPDTMDSRTDGALGQVFLQGENRVAAEYSR